MFTGIIEEIGSIEQIQKGVQSAVLSIQCKKVLDGTKIGDSIAVNGVCLTVTSMHANGYTADVMAETLERSSLAGLKKGSHVNLERAMPADGRFGGHIVAGHIDGTGIVEEITKDETAVWYRISAGEELLRYIVEKGSIAHRWNQFDGSQSQRERFLGVHYPAHAGRDDAFLKKSLGCRKSGMRYYWKICRTPLWC